jgi:predicted ribosomally synthesized peptide with nif11-like leader
MSVQSVKDFLQKMEADPNLRKKLEAAADHEARLQIIRADGFGFTVEEFKQAVAELAAAAGQKLTPEELQEIAAGGQGWHNSACGCLSGIGVGADI